MKILIAEDDPILRQLLEKKFELWGHEVLVTNNGQEAWDMLQAQNIRFLIADWMMPVMDGLELCQRIRSERPSYVYIILLTGKDRKEDAVKGLDAGADDYIRKPFEWDELRARIRAGERILGLLDRVKALSGLLPICASCKKIRDDKGHWQNVETYIRERSDTEFTHGYCPECAKKLYPKYYQEKDKEKTGR
jgi:sigma-B regulation protein RsbU (phosphoserine phosphatase)